MGKVQPIVTLALRAIALAMAVVSVVLSVINTATVEVIIVLLSIGLFALAVAALQKTRD